MKQILKQLIKEYGNPITVLDSELWFDVKAYGTYEFGNTDCEFWSFDGKLYRLCFMELPLKEKEIICCD